MTAEQARVHYDQQSEMKLCVDYMSLPEINIYQADRAAAIQRRGIDCSPYIEMARLKSQRDDAFQETLFRLNQMNLGTTNNYSYGTSSAVGFLKGETISGFNKICFYDKLGDTYTINIPNTSLCPLTN